MTSRKHLLLALSLLAVASVLAAESRPAISGKPTPSSKSAAAYDKSLLQGLQWRSIGPYRGGRVTAVTGVAGQPRVYYFGATGGGVWKTTDGGLRWQPITDGQLGTGSVGAIEVAASDPNVVYVGMGESCIRGNVSHGDGVYKSTDAGKTWKNVGLKETRQIGRVRVHPTNPDVVYVAALGHAFGHNPERGVFRSKDGGATWQKVLFVDDKTGAVDLAMDPTNPRVLFAGFWQALRTPWSLESGGPGSSLWKSVDGGDNWTKLSGEGLPKGVWGRVGVTVSPADPNRVWAIIEAQEGGVFRSDDGGKAWRKVNEERKLRQRAWYYTHIFADPKNAESVYVLNVGFFRSVDGGKTYSAIQSPHGDNHDLWIAPEDPMRMIKGNDGGATVSYDGGASWSSLDNQPTAQFYHAITDDRFPYYVYGAQQDNSTVAIASRTRGPGIEATDWYDVGGCESGYIAAKPKDPDVVYAGCYGGFISRLDRRTGEQRTVTVWPENPMGWGAEGMKYRFQWTFPIVASPHDPETLYAAGNVLFRTRNDGQSWEPISPDLTRNDETKLVSSGGPITQDNTSVEYYATIFAMAESKLEKGLLWAGSDDGLVHVSRDAGRTWSNVTPKDMPEWGMVSQVDPSPHDAGTMYLAVNRYKLDDYKPYAWVTTDYGKTWRRITAGLPDDSFVRVVREDPGRKGLLYAGTETGVHVSFDGGVRWQPLQLNLPVVPVTDLVVKDDDLVASTQGRSFWILDGLGPVRQLGADVAAADVHLFKPDPAVRFVGGGGRAEPPLGQNPPGGAVVYYFLKAEPKEKEEVTLEILDAAGTTIRSFSSLKDEEGAAEPSGDGEGLGPPPSMRKLPAKAGTNRFVWDLRYPDAKRFKGMILWAAEMRGPMAVPGTYQVRLEAAGKTLTQPLELRADPRLKTTAVDYQKQFDLQMKIRDKVSEAHDAIARLRAVRDQVGSAVERAKGIPDEKAIADAADEFKKKLTAVEEALYQTKNQSSQDPLNFPIRLNNKLASLGSVVGSAAAPPTDQSFAVYEDLSKKIDAELLTLKAVIDTDLPAFNQLVRDKNVLAVKVPQ
jgi:photosystem II stability/assembly factor-like uncharacterized protein